MIRDMNANIEDLYLFYHVVDKGGFLKAAEALKVCQGKISRRIARLEALFGTILLYRNMRDIKLTETGKIVFRVALSIVQEMNEAYTAVQNHHHNQSGLINLTVAMGFANYWLMPHLAEFRRMRPDITIHLTTDEWGQGELMMGDADIAISTSRPETREKLQCRLLCEYPFQIYASEDYLARKGTPKSLADLDHHDLITTKGPEPFIGKALFNALLLMGRPADKPRKPSLITTTDLAAVSAGANGMGLIGMPSFFARHYPQLVRVKLDGEEEVLQKEKNKKFITYPQILEYSERHKILIQFIRKKAQEFKLQTGVVLEESLIC